MKTINTFLVPSLSLFLFLFFFGCSTTPEPSIPQNGNLEGTTTTTKKMTLGQLLLKQSKELKKENDLLKERLSIIEENQTADRHNYEKKLNQLNRTIILLEKNIELIKNLPQKPIHSTKNNAQKTITIPKANQAFKNTSSEPIEILAPPTLDNTKPESSKKNQNTTTQTGLVKEIKTPEESKAIESITLVPAIKSSKTDSNKQNNNKSETKSKTLKVKKTAKPLPIKIDNWFDSDLTPPQTPIILSIQPGAKRHYNAAFKIYSQKSYPNAINAFEKFLTRFPNDQDADNSQFWIGQCYYRSGNYVQAEMAFRKVLRNYQHGETQKGFKSPDAILMLGRLYGKNNKPIKSSKYYEYVVKFFPNSQSANKARIELQSMTAFQ
ncbi:MAG: tetratricopeptide repeat protein [Deltaproteobacteria bacterium]|jgi:tol-pal system protein YbgF|nr:tetratricopeptide repeat protein [Deltaproteobacteria bacterium]MBT4525615.1 tetratricopeptide repeat protein [Deltaproteobacteria bacterium]